MKNLKPWQKWAICTFVVATFPVWISMVFVAPFFLLAHAVLFDDDIGIF